MKGYIGEEAASAASRALYIKRLQWTLAGGILVALFVFVDLRTVWARLKHLELSWLLIGVALSQVSLFLHALRWWMIARDMKALMPYSVAVKEYYIGSFVNQCLPTGLAGAALRALRHGAFLRANGDRRGRVKALSAVVFERLSGLVVLVLFCSHSALQLRHGNPNVSRWAWLSILVVCIAGVLSYVLARSLGDKGEGFKDDFLGALWRKGRWIQQGIVSGICLLLLLLIFYCAARATQVELGLWQTFLIAPLILGAMVIPLSFAGWGVRESAAALFFAALGISAAAGVAVSIAFGGIALLASVPGLLLWFRRNNYSEELLSTRNK